MTSYPRRRQVLIKALQTTAAASSLTAPAFAWAQAATTATPKWPVDTLKIIIPAPAGGGVDTLCRRVGERLAAHLGVTFVPDNKPGASGLLACRAIAAAPPNGGTLGMIHSGLVTVQAMGGKLDLLKEFRPLVGRYYEGQFIIAVNADSKYRTLADLLKEITAHPGKLNYGTGGQGSPAEMIFERLKEKQTKLNAQDVPFKGAVDSINALVSKDIDFLIGVMSTVQAQVKSGRLRALAVTGGTRSPLLPEVPTVAESVMPGFSYTAWGGYFGPAKIPDRLVLTLQEVFAKIAKEPDFLQNVAANGSQMSQPESPAEFQAFLLQSIASETATVTRLGLKTG